MFEEEILERLREMHRSGMSYDEIANTTGVARAAIGFYISGAKPIKNPTVNLLMKVFPNCRIDLDGNAPPAPVEGQPSAVSESDAEKIASDAVEDFRNKAVMALLKLDVPADIALEVLKTVSELSPA